MPGEEGSKLMADATRFGLGSLRMWRRGDCRSMVRSSGDVISEGDQLLVRECDL